MLQAPINFQFPVGFGNIMLVSGYKSGYRDTTTIMDLAKNTTCQVEVHPCAGWAITGGSVTYDGALTPIVCGGQGNSYCKACYAYKVFCAAYC